MYSGNTNYYHADYDHYLPRFPGASYPSNLAFFDQRYPYDHLSPGSNIGCGSEPLTADSSYNGEGSSAASSASSNALWAPDWISSQDNTSIYFSRSTSVDAPYNGIFQTPSTLMQTHPNYKGTCTTSSFSTSDCVSRIMPPSYPLNSSLPQEEATQSRINYSDSDAMDAQWRDPSNSVYEGYRALHTGEESSCSTSLWEQDSPIDIEKYIKEEIDAHFKYVIATDDYRPTSESVADDTMHQYTVTPIVLPPTLFPILRTENLGIGNVESRSCNRPSVRAKDDLGKADIEGIVFRILKEGTYAVKKARQTKIVDEKRHEIVTQFPCPYEECIRFFACLKSRKYHLTNAVAGCQISQEFKDQVVEELGERVGNKLCEKLVMNLVEQIVKEKIRNERPPPFSTAQATIYISPAATECNILPTFQGGQYTSVPQLGRPRLHRRKSHHTRNYPPLSTDITPGKSWSNTDVQLAHPITDGPLVSITQLEMQSTSTAEAVSATLAAYWWSTPAAQPVAGSELPQPWEITPSQISEELRHAPAFATQGHWTEEAAGGLIHGDGLALVEAESEMVTEIGFSLSRWEEEGSLRQPLTRGHDSAGPIRHARPSASCATPYAAHANHRRSSQPNFDHK